MPAPLVTGRRRVALAVAAALAAVVVVALAVLRPWSGPHRDVVVEDVSVQQTDDTWRLESLRAVVDGDRAYLLVRLRWPGDPHDGAAIHVAPRLSASVAHRDPYSASPVTCGWPATARDTSDGIVLPCTGDLVPDAIRSVDLREVRPGHG